MTLCHTCEIPIEPSIYMAFENDEDFHPICDFCFEQMEGIQEMDVGISDLYSDEILEEEGRGCSLPSTPEEFSSEKPKYCSDFLQ